MIMSLLLSIIKPRIGITIMHLRSMMAVWSVCSPCTLDQRMSLV